MTDLQLSILLEDVENMRLRIGALERRLGEEAVAAKGPIAEPVVEESGAEAEAAPEPAPVQEAAPALQYSDEQIALWKVAESLLKPAQRDLIKAIIANPGASNESLAEELEVSAQTVSKWRRSCAEAGVVAKSGRGRRVMRVEDKREFFNLQDAAETLIADGKARGQVASVRQNLWMACKSGRRAYDYTWKYIA